MTSHCALLFDIPSSQKEKRRLDKLTIDLSNPKKEEEYTKLSCLIS